MALSTTCRKLLFLRNKLFLPPCRTVVTYYVTLPEVPQDEPDTNALLRDDDIPDYNSLTKEKCGNALLKRGIAYTSGLRKLEDSFKERTLKHPNLSPKEVLSHLIEPLDKLGQPLEAAWGHTQALCGSDKNLIPFEGLASISARLADAMNTRFRSPLIYHACKYALDKAEPGSLTEEQIRVLQKYVLLSMLNGTSLKGRKAEKFYFLQNELNRRRGYFDHLIQRGEQLFKFDIPSSNALVVQEFPEDLLKVTAKNKEEPKLGPWNIILDPWVVNSFLEYCSDSDLRFRLWEGSVSRNAGFNEPKLYTSVILEEIRDRRQAIAKALGYETYVDMVMTTEMAGTKENVISVLDQLLEKARPAQIYEIETLNKFASANGFHKTIDVWDVPYWKRRHAIATFGSNEVKISEYFPLEKVLEGLFRLTKTLFDVDIRPKSDVTFWHPDCKYFEIFEAGEEESIASFVLDPYDREGKLTFETGVVIRNRSNIGGIVKPLVAIFTAYSTPSLGRPSLLSFNQVRHLFSQFGHLLHVALTKCNYSDVSGRNFMDCDAAEISSKFFGQWVFQERVLSSISGHFISNDTLPKEMIDSLNRTRRHMIGYKLCETLYESRVDLELHTSDAFWRDIMQELWPRHFVFPLHKSNYHVCHAANIISGGSCSKLYGELWNDILGVDAFSAFQEAGLENDEQLAVVGKRYRDTFLACGGSVPTSELYRRFRGRDLSLTAFLQLTGLQKPPKTPANKS